MVTTSSTVARFGHSKVCVCVWLILVYAVFQVSPWLKSGTLRNGERTGYMLSKTGNNSVEQCVLWFMLLAELLECTLSTSNCGSKTSCNIPTKRPALTVTVQRFKEKCTQNPKCSYCTPYCHFRWMQCLLVQFSRMHCYPISHIEFINKIQNTKISFVAH